MTGTIIWGLAPLLVLFLLAMAVLWLIDRRLLFTILRTFGLAVVQMAAVGVCVWALMLANRWWAYALWMLALPIVMAAVTVRREHFGWNMLVPMAGGMLVAVGVVSALLMVYVPIRLFMPVAALLAAALFESQRDAVCAYVRSFDNTQAHRYYLLANGASQAEALMPSVRRALRACLVPQMRRLSMPLVLTGTMLFWGMLLGGATGGSAAVMTVVMAVAALVAVVAEVLTTAFLLKRMNVCS